MPFHNRQEETLDRQGIDQLQREKLAALLSHTADNSPFYRERLADDRFDVATDPISALPLTTRDDIETDQRDHPPYGTRLTYPVQRYVRLHQTSGSRGQPLRCLDTADDWKWWKKCWAIIYTAGGVLPNDRFFVPFSFGPFIGFWAAFEAAVAMDCLCLAAGGMTTTARLRHLLENEATVICCTPTYAMHMADVAVAEGLDLPSSAVRLLIVAGEPGGSIEAVRSRIESGWGARVLDHAGMTEVGPWGFECVEQPGGLHVLESEFIAEVIDPKSCETVAEGQPGELVLTNLGRWGSPLIRYRTGDRVTMTSGRCACGRWFARVEGGVRGRFDDMMLIRGNNVFPSTIEGIIRGFDEVAEFKLIVDRRDAMADLCIELEPRDSTQTADLTERVENEIRNKLHFRPAVSLVPPGTLPRFEMKANRLEIRT